MAPEQNFTNSAVFGISTLKTKMLTLFESVFQKLNIFTIFIPLNEMCFL